MGIFRSKREPELDLSDDSLLAEAMEAAVEELPAAEPDAEQAERAEQAEPGADNTQSAVEAALAPQPSRAEQEQIWRAAATENARHWPQLMSDPRRLLAKMADISARYGDSSLWQRAPAGIMREAAIELYGLPQGMDSSIISGAVKQAHAEGRRLAENRHQAKLGLAPPRGASVAPPLVSEEQRIIREMMAARRGGIF